MSFCGLCQFFIAQPGAAWYNRREMDFVIQGAQDGRRSARGGDMIQFVLCDDSASFLDVLRREIRTILSKRGWKGEIRTFTSWESIPAALFQSGDIYILDIDFAQAKYTGIDIARALRAVREGAIVIFVSNYIAYAPEGYEVQAFRYLLKKDIPVKLEECLQQAVEKLRTCGEYLSFVQSGEPFRIRTQDIYFLESDGHASLLYGRAQEEPRRIYTALSKLTESLEEHGFLRIHRRYTVNMRHLVSLRCDAAVLDDGRTLPVGKPEYAQKKQRFLLWKGRQ